MSTPENPTRVTPPTGPLWFESAADETRRLFDGESPRALQTERIITGQLRMPRAPRRIGWFLPAIALALSSAAFAKQVRQEVVRLVSELHESFTSAAVTPPALPEGGPRVRAQAASVDDNRAVPPNRLDAQAVAADAGAVFGGQRAVPKRSVSSPARRETPVSLEASAVTSGSLDSPTSESDLELYRLGHQAHFVQHDWSLALERWNAYLEHSRSNVFTPEVRYNRAIALFELGRTVEAQQALAPFARRAYGDYRVKEAQVLLDRLRHQVAP